MKEIKSNIPPEEEKKIRKAIDELLPLEELEYFDERPEKTGINADMVELIRKINLISPAYWSDWEAKSISLLINDFINNLFGGGK